MLFGCGDRQDYPSSLTLADSLCDHDPDHALHLLDSLRPLMEEADQTDQMYHQLLCIKSADKAYSCHHQWLARPHFGVLCQLPEKEKDYMEVETGEISTYGR